MFLQVLPPQSTKTAPAKPAAPPASSWQTKSQVPATPAGVQAHAQVQLKPREIADRDFISVFGLDGIAALVTVTLLSIICSTIVYGVVLALLRKAFGSEKEEKAAYDDAEKMAFDLIERKAKAAARIDGLQAQLEAVTHDMNRRFPLRAEVPTRELPPAKAGGF